MNVSASFQSCAYILLEWLLSIGPTPKANKATQQKLQTFQISLDVDVLSNAFDLEWIGHKDDKAAKVRRRDDWCHVRYRTRLLPYWRLESMHQTLISCSMWMHSIKWTLCQNRDWLNCIVTPKMHHQTLPSQPNVIIFNITVCAKNRFHYLAEFWRGEDAILCKCTTTKSSKLGPSHSVVICGRSHITNCSGKC